MARAVDAGVRRNLAIAVAKVEARTWARRTAKTRCSGVHVQHAGAAVQRHQTDAKRCVSFVRVHGCAAPPGHHVRGHRPRPPEDIW